VNQLTACLKSYYPVALTLFERIIFALWSKHEPYQATIFLAAQQAHGHLVA
jgi:hypothetical protein